MKRKPIIIAFALLLIVGAALWGVNYRLDHPPLSYTDKELRATIAGFDEVEIYEEFCDDTYCNDTSTNPVRVKAAQAHELVKDLRLAEEKYSGGNWGGGNSPAHYLIHLRFLKKKSSLCHIFLIPTNKGMRFVYQTPRGGVFMTVGNVNSRSTMRLNRALDAYLPQRVRP